MSWLPTASPPRACPPPCSCLHSNDSELINPSHSNVESRLSTRGLSSQSVPLCATRTYATLCIQPRPAVESLSRALSALALLYRLNYPPILSYACMQLV